MPEIKQIERIIRILQRLAVKSEITVAELYEYFERQVSKRTLQRDLIELSAADIPLVTHEGKNRQLVWSIAPNYLRFVPATLQPKELVASWLLHTMTGVFSGTPLERDAKSFIAKAKQLAPPEIFMELGAELQPIFGMTYSGYIDYRPQAEIISRLIAAITARRVVKFTYKPHWKDKPSVFDGHCYTILFHKGALYLVTFLPRHVNYVLLPVQRIRDVELLKETFARDKSFSLDKIRSGRFGIFGYEGQKPERVVLRFDKEIADIIAERVWHPSQKITRHRDGSLTLEMNVVISDELKGWIASWRGWVKAPDPQSMK